MKKVESKEYNSENQLYDPDIVPIIMCIIGALGTLSGIVKTLEYIERKRYERKDRRLMEERREDIKSEISYIFSNVFLSFESISRRLELIIRICQVLPENKNNFYNRIFSFGNCHIFLNSFQIKAYQNEQSLILKEIDVINNNVIYVEKLIAENPDLVSDINYIRDMRLQNQLSQIITEINNLMQRFGKIMINEFLEKTIQLCRDINEMLRNFEV